LKEVPLSFGGEKGAFPTPVNITDPSIWDFWEKFFHFGTFGKRFLLFLFAKEIKKLKKVEILDTYKI
jgi:hypothetical protein